MKPRRYAQGQFSQNIPELIQQLRGLYVGMETDPTLADSAQHIRAAVAALEAARQAAVEVYEECRGRKARSRAAKPSKTSREAKKEAAEWLRNLEPASPWKQ
jgi:hypothetical protein